MSKLERPSSDELIGNPVWDEYQRQLEMSDQLNGYVNLTEIWRISGRHWMSPRRYVKGWPHMVEGAKIIGNRPDDPVMVQGDDALDYVQRVSVDIQLFMMKVFSYQIRQDPVGRLLDAADNMGDGENADGARAILGMFVSAANAVDGSRTEGDARLIEEAVERTSGLDIWSQETKIAKAQRALSAAKKITTGRVIDGEFMQDL